MSVCPVMFDNVEFRSFGSHQLELKLSLKSSVMTHFDKPLTLRRPLYVSVSGCQKLLMTA